MDKSTIEQIRESLIESYNETKKAIEKQKSNKNVSSSELEKYDSILQGYKMAISDIEVFLNITILQGNEDIRPIRYK